MNLLLDYTPPLDWSFILGYLGGRVTPCIDMVDGDRYVRAVEVEGDSGTLSVSPSPSTNQLIATVHGIARRHAPSIKDRLRTMFDLDRNPTTIHTALASDPLIGPLVADCPGIRVPGAWCAFELLARTIVNQQISVKAAGTIMRRITERLGRDLGIHIGGERARLFPWPASLAEGSLEGIGMPSRRAAVLQSVARSIAEGSVPFVGSGAGTEEIKRSLLALPGIGPWTVEYFALRALRDPDAWPDSDLVLLRAVNGHPLSRSAHETWRPYRAYAAMHLWRNASQPSV